MMKSDEIHSNNSLQVNIVKDIGPFMERSKYLLLMTPVAVKDSLRYNDN